MQANPFVPFRIHTTDGRHFDVPNHDSAMLFNNYVMVATGPVDDGFAFWSERVAYLHIVSIRESAPQQVA
jgi:hypothetical protein